MQPEPKKERRWKLHASWILFPPQRGIKWNDENKKKTKVLFHAYQSIKNSLKKHSSNQMMRLVWKREAFQLSSVLFPGSSFHNCSFMQKEIFKKFTISTKVHQTVMLLIANLLAARRHLWVYDWGLPRDLHWIGQFIAGNMCAYNWVSLKLGEEFIIDISLRVECAVACRE
jgi:hypothetical protein